MPPDQLIERTPIALAEGGKQIGVGIGGWGRELFHLVNSERWSEDCHGFETRALRGPLKAL